MQRRFNSSSSGSSSSSVDQQLCCHSQPIIIFTSRKMTMMTPGRTTRLPSCLLLGRSTSLLSRSTRSPNYHHRLSATQNNFSSSSIAARPSAPPATTTTTQAPPPPPEVEVKLIGIGSRGAAVLQKLVGNGKKMEGTSLTDVWCLDVDKKVVEAFTQGVVLSKEMVGNGRDEISEEKGPLSAEELAAIVGRTASDAGGRGNIGSADGGVAFILGPAAAVPGGAALVLQLVTALRAAGHFTVAAVTAPFEFEGGGKAEQARSLVAALEEKTHLVAVMEQEVLLQAFGDSQLTVAEATEIADNALEHTARSVLQAVQAQELLKSSRGALMWHGRDLRHYKRLLTPPLQQLLTCPGTAVVGRGLASLPSAAGHSMGAAKALMHLASDAVIAAAESPFLDGALDSASAVLCCINLPPISQQFLDAAGVAAPFAGVQTAEGERQATRMAAQAAAGALRSITGRSCDDFVLCVEPLKSKGGAAVAEVVHVEATLLVLRAPNSGGGGGSSTPSSSSSSNRNNTNGNSNSSGSAATPGSSPPPQKQQQQQQAPPPPPSQRQPASNNKLSSSNWSMLSAMAGGSTKGKDRAASAPSPSTSTPSGRKQQAGAPSLNFFAGGGAQTPPSTPLTAASVSPSQQQQQQQQAAPQPITPVVQERVTVGDYLVGSLTAQSLDLPPAAAKWRQAQRIEQLRQRRLVVWEVDETEAWEESEEEDQAGVGALKGLFGGGRRRQQEKPKKVDIKSRVAGMLAQDREDGWEADSNSSASSS